MGWNEQECGQQHYTLEAGAPWLGTKRPRNSILTAALIGPMQKTRFCRVRDMTADGLD